MVFFLNTALKEEVFEMKQKNEALQTKNSSLENEVKERKESEASLKSDLEEIRSAPAALQTELTEFKEQAKALQTPAQRKIMMTSLNGNIFRVAGLLWGESTGHRWIPLTKANDAELLCFLWYAPKQTVDAGDLIRHHDVIVMISTSRANHSALLVMWLPDITHPDNPHPENIHPDITHLHCRTLPTRIVPTHTHQFGTKRYKTYYSLLTIRKIVMYLRNIHIAISHVFIDQIFLQDALIHVTFAHVMQNL